MHIQEYYKVITRDWPFTFRKSKYLDGNRVPTSEWSLLTCNNRLALNGEWIPAARVSWTHVVASLYSLCCMCISGDGWVRRSSMRFAKCREKSIYGYVPLSLNFHSQHQSPLVLQRPPLISEISISSQSTYIYTKTALCMCPTVLLAIQPVYGVKFK